MGKMWKDDEPRCMGLNREYIMRWWKKKYVVIPIPTRENSAE
jgi:hypothetical protein